MVKKIMMLALILIMAVVICGCTISQGVFIGMSQYSSATSLEASYQKFDGSIARRVSLKAGDEVTFSYLGDDELAPVVKKGSEELCGITDGGTFTAKDNGSYDFTVRGNAKDGGFSLSWEIE